MGNALLKTFALYLGPNWTPELAATWKGTYEAIATTMLAGAEDPEANLEPELTFYDWVDLYG